MKRPVVAFVSYSDSQFSRAMGEYLTSEFNALVNVMDPYSDTMVSTCEIDVALINAEAFNSKSDPYTDITFIRDCFGTSSVPPILMLSSNTKAADFLRNQTYKITDIINLDDGLDQLGRALRLLLDLNHKHDADPECDGTDPGCKGDKAVV